ncbi:MAG TPA: response regulator, partial [Syntrophobacteraceae bacterium]|nr:response regulator [Syntrophobacteraceae bacterium]
LLLVDDEESYVNVLSKRMTKRNFEVSSALSGAQALRILRKQDFDAVVLDLKMEDMDGIEVLKIFKKMAPDLPVIMLTGHGSEKAAREGLAHGAYDYLMKPCELEELLEKINEACRGGGGPVE